LASSVVGTCFVCKGLGWERIHTLLLQAHWHWHCDRFSVYSVQLVTVSMAMALRRNVANATLAQGFASKAGCACPQQQLNQCSWAIIIGSVQYNGTSATNQSTSVNRWMFSMLLGSPSGGLQGARPTAEHNHCCRVAGISGFSFCFA
jgi:hypothetical protein